MSICYLSKNYKGISAGNKAKMDIEDIFQSNNFRNVGIKRTASKNKVLSFLYTLIGVLKIPFSLRKGDILVLQYPIKKYFPLICNMAHFRRCKVVTVIHDLGSFRRRRLTPEAEAALLNHSDYVIAHNESMKKWLEQHNVTIPIGCLKIFDYLSEAKPESETILNKPYTVLFAGALNPRKSGFLYKFGEYIKDYKFDLYGVEFDAGIMQYSDRIEYKGYISSDQLIAGAKGHFGLVWDGDSASACSGTSGEYLKYNNPHKTSFYIRCHLPVILWKQAALAPFVKEHKIGLCVDSLENLDDILASVSDEEYKTIKENVKKMSDRLAQGYYILHAVNEAKELLSKEASVQV